MLLLALCAFFLFADQNLLAPNLTQIADEFGFDAVQRDKKLGGDIALVFWLIGGTVSVLVGLATDRINRRNLFAVIVLFGEIPCLLTGFARDYDDLILLRAATGLGIGGAMPLLYSLLGDWYGKESRATATALIGFAMGLGIAVGQLISGFVGPEYGWRLPFILVAVPNFALAVVFFLTVKEPQRGAMEEALEPGQKISVRWSDYKEAFKVPTAVMVFLQGLPGTVPWGVFFVFLNDFYAQDKGYSVQAATLIVMVLGAFAILGALVGGLVGNWLYNKDNRYLPILCGSTTILGMIPVALLISYPSQLGVEDPSVLFPMILGALSGFTISITGPNVRAILLNVTSPETRGSVFSLYNLADTLGNGLGPAIIALLIASMGRVGAFHVANGFWLFCGIVLLAMSFTFVRDQRAIQERLAARAG